MRDDLVDDRPANTSFGWWIRNDAHRLFSLVNTPCGEVFGSALFLPPFGLNALNLFMPAFYTASSGIRTVRFDGRNNIGFSQGEICDFRVGTVLEDARFAAEHLVKTFGSDDFIIFGMSLTASIALLLARNYPRARVVLFVPVVDVCGAIKLGAGDDTVFDAYRRRDENAAKVRKIFGHDVHGQPFYDDLVESGLGTVAGVLDAASGVRGRVDLVLAGNDEFSSPSHRQSLIEALDAKDRTIVLERSTHDFGRLPATRNRAFTRLIEIGQAHFEVPVERRRAGLPADENMVAAARMERAAVQTMADRFRTAA